MHFIILLISLLSLLLHTPLYAQDHGAVVQWTNTDPGGEQSFPTTICPNILDSNTCVRWSAADTLQLVTGGTARIEVTTTQATTTVIVGINDATPDAQLDVVNSLASQPILRLEHASTPSANYVEVASTGAAGGNIFVVDSSGNIGGGVTTPVTKFHMRIASSGATPNPTYVMTLESFGSTGLQILTDSTKTQTIAFGDPSDNDVGRIHYDHATDTMSLWTFALQRLTINSSGNAALGNSSASGRWIVSPPTTQTIAAGNTIAADGCGTTKPISAAGAVTTDTTNTFTAPAAANTGCLMQVCNVGTNTITLDRNALFETDGGTDIALAADECVIVNNNGAKWRQSAPKSTNS